MGSNPTFSARSCSLAFLRGYFFAKRAKRAELAGRGCGGWAPHTGVPEIVTHPPHPHPAAKSSVSAQKFSPAKS